MKTLTLKISLIALSFNLMMFASCRKTEKTKMTISGRILNSSTLTPIKNGNFKLSFFETVRDELWYHSTNAKPILRMDSLGNFTNSFTIDKNTNYKILNEKDSIIYEGNENGSLGDLFSNP